MKKVALFLALMMVCMMAVGAVAMAETKLGQAMYAAHGTRAFCIATVAMDGDKISAVLIEEFQFMDPAGDGVVAVPNPEAFMNADATRVLASKRFSDKFYSANMANSGATQTLVTSYTAIEVFCVGKTVAELEAAVEGKTNENSVPADIVTGSTLTDTVGYLNAIIAAAKNVK